MNITKNEERRMRVCESVLREILPHRDAINSRCYLLKKSVEIRRETVFTINQKTPEEGKFKKNDFGLIPRRFVVSIK